MTNEVCEHGSQRRKCVQCELIAADKRIAELEAKNEFAVKRIADLMMTVLADESSITNMQRKINELEAEMAEAERLLLLFPPHFYNTTEVGDWLERRKAKP